MLSTEKKLTTGPTPGMRTVATAGLLLCCISAATADNALADEATAYIDSVNSWGTWELGIEPAAGPRAVSSHVMTVRSADVQFRPNDNAAYRPNAVTLNENMPISGNPPGPIAPIPPGTAQSERGAAPPTGDPRNR